MNTWHTAYTRDIGATPDAVWAVLADTAAWHLWNDGVKSIRLDGEFATGGRFAMEMPDGDVLESTLTSVVPGQQFVDETRLGDIVVRVAHRIDAVSAGSSRVTYAVDVDGPDAQAVGEAVSGDFPAVLEKLEAYVLRQAAACAV